MKRTHLAEIVMVLGSVFLQSCKESKPEGNLVFYQDSCKIVATGKYKIKSIRIDDVLDRNFPPLIDTAFITPINDYQLCRHYDLKKYLQNPYVHEIQMVIGMAIDTNLTSQWYIQVNKADSAKKIIEGVHPRKD